MKKKDTFAKILFIILVLGSFILLTCSYATNKFGIVDQNWFATWQEDSEWCVWQRIYDDLKLGFKFNYGLLGEWSPNPGTYNINHAAYTGQSGLQGFVYGVFYRLFNGNISPVIYYWLTSGAFVLCMFIILWWLYNEFGIVSSIAAYGILFFNQWLTVAARNMYWVIFTLVLPLVVTLTLLVVEEKKGLINTKLLYVFSFVTIFMKAACGFEFISLAMINLELPLFYYAIKSKWSVSKFLKRFAGNGMAAMTAFFLAIILCVFQVKYYTNSSLMQALKIWGGHVTYRISGLADINNYSGIVRESLMASKIEVIIKYLNEGTPLIFGMRMSILLILCLLGMVCCLVSKDFCLKIETNRNKLLALCALLIISITGPLSWFVLASGHAYVHTHICYILWSLPFLVLGGALLFTVAFWIIQENLQKLKGSFKIYVLIIFLVIGCFAYNDICFTGNNLLQIYGENQDWLYKEGKVKLFLGDNNTLFFIAEEGATNDEVLLSVYGKDDALIRSDQFDFSKYEVTTYFWKNERICRIELPPGYRTVLIGQIKKTGEKNWSVNLNLSVPNVINIANVTDQNWDKGISRNEKCILVQADSKVFKRLIGYRLEYAPGKSIQVVNVLDFGNDHLIYYEGIIEESGIERFKVFDDINL